MEDEHKFDPVTPIAKEGVLPDISPEDIKSKKEKNSDKSRSNAANDLRSVDDAAANQDGIGSSDVLDDNKAKEESGGLYIGDVKNSGRGRRKKGLKGRFGKLLPMLLILCGVSGVGGLMGITQLFQPFSLVAQFTESFNSMNTSANLRSSAFFRMQMDTGRYKNPIKATIFGSEKFKITESQATKLKAQNIEYDEHYDIGGGETARVLKFTDADGNMRIVTADVDTAGRIDGAVDFKTLYRDDVEFFNRYNAGSMTWRGAIANWFGSLTDRFFKNNNLTRDMFDGFQKKVADNGGDSITVVKDTLSARTDTIEGGGFYTENGVEKQEGTDENGDPIYKSSDVEGVNPSDPDASGVKADDKSVSGGSSKMSRKAMNVASKFNDIAGTVQKGANIACTIGNVIGSVTLLVTAAEALQIINLATAYFETVDKVKAGYGDDAPIHDLTNALNNKKKNENAVIELTSDNLDLNDSADNVTDDGVVALDTEYYSTEKSAMQASGVSALYGGGPVDVNDPSVASFNFTRYLKRIFNGIGISMGGFRTCAIAKIATSIISVAGDAVEVGSCLAGLLGALFTFGVSLGACAGVVIDVVKSAVMSVAIGLAVNAVLKSILPFATKVLTRDLVSDLGGEDLGNALTSGGNMYLGNSHRFNGGSLATKDKYVEFAMRREQVVAENAKYERSAMNPFDITSKYTFMGTILTQMMGLLTADSLAGIVRSSGSMVSSSVLALSPSAVATTKMIEESLPDEDSYESTCPYLASIGAIGDAYCNPYSVTDISTTGADPADVVDALDSIGSFLDDETGDGNVKINGKSDLAKYILYCDGRQSAFGVVDQNIASDVMEWGDVRTDSSTFNTVANAAIGAVPVLGDVVDIVQSEEALANHGYISGESCVAGNNIDTSYEENVSPDWNTAKYYQRFIEDQALAESMGLIDKSAVSAFLDEYYEQNPLDNSYEGVLARKSGLRKDTVVAILDLVEYSNYIANYNPTERYAFGVPTVKMDDEIKFDNEYELSGIPTLLNQIIYADVRNRNFVV